ncbi:FxsA family protein [Marinicrinis lubricantis]|uniref:FxsA family protein n=1 Tax=Marinicrinis lubricantis TaxID=2086470 RepID=A0ABW1IHS0_9BACL
MFKFIVPILIIVPAVEILGFLTIGSWIGALPTFLLVLATGFLGAFLAKSQAEKVWKDAAAQFSSGKIPGKSILDGICIFTGGLLLLTPGFFTDAIGLLLLLPGSRMFFRLLLLQWIRKGIEKGNIRFFGRFR